VEEPDVIEPLPPESVLALRVVKKKLDDTIYALKVAIDLMRNPS